MFTEVDHINLVPLVLPHVSRIIYLLWVFDDIGRDGIPLRRIKQGQKRGVLEFLVNSDDFCGCVSFFSLIYLGNLPYVRFFGNYNCTMQDMEWRTISANAFQVDGITSFCVKEYGSDHCLAGASKTSPVLT